MFVVDTASLTWLLVSTILVWIMIPGIGLFYSGMTKRKSGLSVLWLSFMAVAVTSVQVCHGFEEEIVDVLIFSVVSYWIFAEFQFGWFAIYW